MISQLDNYVYLRHKLKLDNLTAEVKRAIGVVWAAFGRLRSIFNSKMNNVKYSNYVSFQCLPMEQKSHINKIM